jgi:hypothetical protein
MSATRSYSEIACSGVRVIRMRIMFKRIRSVNLVISGLLSVCDLSEGEHVEERHYYSVIW